MDSLPILSGNPHLVENVGIECVVDLVLPCTLGIPGTSTGERMRLEFKFGRGALRYGSL